MLLADFELPSKTGLPKFHQRSGLNLLRMITVMIGGCLMVFIIPIILYLI